MFTGIITEIGKIVASQAVANGSVLTIHAPASVDEINIGDSVAVNGVCLTATAINGKNFDADVSSETLKKSTLSELKTDQPVNLELAMQVGGRLGGHIVQGHVDGRAVVSDVNQDGEGYLLSIDVPNDLTRYTVAKGSITINGISLTIAHLNGNSCRIAVIPHTYKETILHTLKVGSMVNIEVDILAKYVESMLGARSTQPNITEDYLKEHGFVK